MNTDTPETVEAYLENIPAEYRQELERIRGIVKALVPEAVESISYQMPAFKYKKRPLLYYAAFKHHMSLFPTPGPTDSLRDELARYETGKGTIKFTLEDTLPKDLIEKIVRARLIEIG